jgi:hypothetical protein
MTKKEKDLVESAAKIAFESVMELAGSHHVLRYEEAMELARHVSEDIKRVMLTDNETSSTTNRKKLQKTKSK